MVCFQNPEERLQNLKRKLKTDRENANEKRKRIEEDRRERKRIREKERYHEKKRKLREEKEIDIALQVSPQLDANLIEDEQSSVTLDFNDESNNVISTPNVRNEVINQKSSGKMTVDERRIRNREKVRTHRAKVYANSDLYEQFLDKQKKNNLSRKERGLRTISNLDEKQQKIQRNLWRKSQAKHRKNKKEREDLLNDESIFETYPPTSKNLYKEAGARKARKNRCILKKKIKKLTEEKEKLVKQKSDLKRSLAKYQRRSQRLQKANLSSPNKKTAQVMKMGTAEIEKELSFSFALQSQIKANYNASSELEKTAVAKVIAGNVIKKQRSVGKLRPLVSIRRIQYNKKKPGFIPNKQVWNQCKSMSFKQVIHEFFCDSENTSQSPNKGDFLTFKKQKKLKRYLNI